MARLLAWLPPPAGDPDLLVGPESWSDCGVYRVSDTLALVQTVDFFTPVLDDPFDYGRVAAANALSDVYAMGATPRTALSIVAFAPDELDLSVLGEILRGGCEVLARAGVALVGGHSVRDRETKFGFAVTGFVDPAKLVTNAGARPGDALALTKPLGSGVLTTALKRGRLPDEDRRAVTEMMAALNDTAARLMVVHGATAATDVTGFGLLGHARNIAAASGVTLRLDAAAVPVLPRVREFIEEGVFAAGLANNERFFERDVDADPGIERAALRALYDPQTSGGLLVALPPDRAESFIAAARAEGLPRATIVGEVMPRGRAPVEVAARRA